MPGVKRGDYIKVILARRLRDSPVLPSRELGPEAPEDASRKLTRAGGDDLIRRNCALHRRLADHRWKLASEPGFSRRNPAADRAGHAGYHAGSCGELSAGSAYTKPQTRPKENCIGVGI